MQGQVVVIGYWGQPKRIRLQNFIVNGESVYPMVSDEAAFKRQIVGSGFEMQGLIIKVHFLLSLLRGDEVFLLNPATPSRCG